MEFLQVADNTRELSSLNEVVKIAYKLECGFGSDGDMVRNEIYLMTMTVSFVLR